MLRASTFAMPLLKRCFVWLLFMVLIVGSASGQTKAKLKTAKKYLDRKNYQEAIEIYLEILDKYDDAEAKINIAECYRYLRNPHEQEYWYGQVVLLPQASPEAMRYYAEALHRNGKYDKAKEWVKRYLEYNPNDMSAQMLKKACDESKIKNLKASGVLYKVQPVKELNSNVDDYAPTYYKDGIAFCTNRDRGSASVKIDARTGNPFSELFTAQVSPIDDCSDRLSKPKKLHQKLSSEYHDGPASFSPDGSVVYFTRNNMDGKGMDGMVRLKVYKAEASGSGWGNPQSLPFNSDEYSVMHPSLSPDQTMLFFASDMPGGFGGMDLYVSYLENGRWSPPINIGPTVNTERDEVFPFIHEDPDKKEKTLYFSSNGHVGLGGLDVYFSKEVYGSWSDPINLGSPVNSQADDFGFITNGKKTKGFFSSNREGDGTQGGDELYSFCKLSVEVEILVFNKNDSQPLEGAEVFVSCSPVESFVTDRDGKVRCELPLDKACDFAAEKQGFKPNSVRKGTEGLAAGDPLFVTIPLEVERVFDLSGTVTDGYSKTPVDGALVSMTVKCDGDEEKFQELTDAQGKYEFKEIREGCDCQVKVTKSGYTEAVVTFSTGDIGGETPLITRDMVINCKGGPNCPQPDDICNGDPNCGKPHPYCPGCMSSCNATRDTLIIRDAMGVIVGKQPCPGKDCPNCKGSEPIIPVNPIVGPKTLVHIFYDFDDARIRKDAVPALKDLIAFMEEYPSAIILLTSHTDARGNRAYNKRLSNRRAESVIAYLLDHGIDKNRLRAKGMGEEVMLNECYDGVECSEEQHQENRRTEFQVVGSTTKSSKPDKIKVRPCRNCPSTPEVEGEGEGQPIDFETTEETTTKDEGDKYIEFIKREDLNKQDE